MAGELTTYALSQGIGLVLGGVGQALSLISQTGDTTLLVISDSLGNETFEPIYKMALDLAADFPTHTVRYSLYDITGNVFPAYVTLATGTGPNTIYIRNGAIPQSQPARVFSESEYPVFFDPAVIPDGIIWQHGKNVAAEQMQNARMQSAWEMARLAYPNAFHIAILEPPNRDDNVMASMIASLMALAAEYADVGLIDCYTPWMEAGKPSGWYTDNLHPNETGVDAGSRPAVRAFMKNGKRPVLVTPARVLTKITPINANGDFSNWSAAVPVGYTVVSSPVLAKDTVNKRENRPYSLQMSGPAGADLRWEADATQRAALAGQFITIAIWEYVDAGNPVTSGVHQLIISDEISSNDTKTVQRTADNAGRQPSGRWVLTIIRSQRAVGTTPTVIRLVNENDTGTANSTTRIDRIVVSAGIYPRDMNAASA